VTTSPARRLILIYVALSVLLYLFALLPGNPEYSSVWSFVGWVVFEALVVWRLWHGSLLAWLISFGAAVLTVIGLVLMAAPVEFGTIFILVVAIVQGITLASPSLLSFVWSAGETPAGSH